MTIGAARVENCNNADWDHNSYIIRTFIDDVMKGEYAERCPSENIYEPDRQISTSYSTIVVCSKIVNSVQFVSCLKDNVSKLRQHWCYMSTASLSAHGFTEDQRKTWATLAFGMRIHRYHHTSETTGWTITTSSAESAVGWVSSLDFLSSMP